MGKGYEKVYKYGIDAVISIIDSPMEISHAEKNARFLIEKATERAFSILSIGLRMKCRMANNE